MARVPVSTFDEPMLYPFIEDSNGYLKFPKHQLCRQNSTLAILAVDPSHVNIHLTRSRNYNLLKSRQTQNQSPSISSSNSRESIEKIKLNANVDDDDEQLNELKVRSELTLTSVDKVVERIDRRVDSGKYISSQTFFESSVTDIDRKSPSEMDDDKDMQLVGQNLLQISKGMDFLTCDINTVCLLLNHDKLGVSNESVVFRAAYKWLTYDRPSTRLVYGDRIMRCVRFGLMRPRDLIKCFIRCQKIALMDSSDFCEQLFIGLLWSIAKKYDLTHLIDELKPKERQSNDSDDSFSDEPVFSSGISSRVSLASYQSSMTDVSVSINKYDIENK